MANKIGLDKAIAYSSGARLIQGGTGVLSVLFIMSFLTKAEQGFYYTFGSILAMQVFFELGLTGIMTQYVAHEASHLILISDDHFEGDGRHKSRLASLVLFCIKWYSLLAIIVFVFLLIVGNIYFNKYGMCHSEVSWRIPWILISVGTSLNLFQSPFISIFTGLGKVKEMAKIGFWQQILTPSIIWIGLACNLKLYVVGLSYIISVVIWQVYVWETGLMKIIICLIKSDIIEEVKYFKEIFPYQWRIAISWVSGYFIFNFINPVLFAAEGAIAAGQMGMTLQALNAIQSLSFSWLNTKVPVYSRCIAQKDYHQLNSLFNKTLKQMTSVCLFLLFVFFSIIVLLNLTQLKVGDNIIAHRFLGYIPLLLMMIPVFLQQYVYSWATYLRCHKKEPLMLYSICTAIITGLSILLGGKLYGTYGISLCYCIVSIISFPWVYYIYRLKRREWHTMSYED